MCGLFGFDFSKKELPQDRMSILVDSLAADNDQRGGHSWGYYLPDKGHLKKGLGNLFDSMRACRRIHSARRAMVHTRYASTGSVVKRNAHPFRIGKIVGAHNGCLSNHYDLNACYDRRFEVDSMHLFAHLDEGCDMEEIEAYGAITWIDTNRPNTIRISQFNNGEIAVYDVEGYGLAWSSSEKHLVRALRHAGLSRLSKPYTDIKDGEVALIIKGDLYQTEHRIECSPFLRSTTCKKWDEDLAYGLGTKSSPSSTFIPYQPYASTSNDKKEASGKWITDERDGSKRFAWDGDMPTGGDSLSGPHWWNEEVDEEELSRLEAELGIGKEEEEEVARFPGLEAEEKAYYQALSDYYRKWGEEAKETTKPQQARTEDEELDRLAEEWIKNHEFVNKLNEEEKSCISNQNQSSQSPKPLNLGEAYIASISLSNSTNPKTSPSS